MQRLEEALKVDGSYILHVGVWNQNVDFMEEDTPIPLPAVLVEFMPIRWQPVKEPSAIFGNGEIRLHVITHWHEPADDFAAFRVTQQMLTFITHVGGSEDDFSISYPSQTVTNHNHGEVMESIEILNARYRRSLE